MLIENYSGRAVSHVLVRVCEVLAASWSSSSFIRKSMNAAKLQSLAFPVVALELSLRINRITKEH